VLKCLCDRLKSYVLSLVVCVGWSVSVDVKFQHRMGTLWAEGAVLNSL
jgi:hypothetical protein